MFLQVNQLCVEYRARGRVVPALTDVTFGLPKGSTLGLVGESGCGKTTLALSLLDLLPTAGSIRSGQILLDGIDLIAATAEERRKSRWTKIAYVPQGAANSLDPVQTIWKQFRRISVAHARTPDAELRKTAEQLFESVQLTPSTLDRYPHQLSGGMRQRALMAIALLFKPQLLVADEPTTGLDVIVQRQVLQVLRHLQQEGGMTIVLVSHDIGVIAETAKFIAVMYAGCIVESGPTRDVLGTPLHPYSMGLREAFPDIRKTTRADDQSFGGIPGAPPRLDQPIRGCAFAPRCPFAKPICESEAPALREFGSQRVACHFAEDAKVHRQKSSVHGTWLATEILVVGMSDELAMEAIDLSKRFGVSRNIWESIVGTNRFVHALDKVSLQLRRGRTISVVGESGSGKSTLANVLVGLEKPDSGRILVGKDDISSLSAKALRTFRGTVQMVFQDPFGSLNPRFTVAQTVEEPLIIRGMTDRDERRKRVFAALEEAELKPADLYYGRRPHELSGGQRQRVAIARAIVVEPSVLIADEPVSMLDVSVRAGILRLLDRLVKKKGMALLCITHDLSIVGPLSDEIAIMFHGRVVEFGNASQVLQNPQHHYTRQLLAAVPLPDPEATTPELPAAAFTPVVASDTGGCSFRVRCPNAKKACATDKPELLLRTDGRSLACHFPGDPDIQVRSEFKNKGVQA